MRFKTISLCECSRLGTPDDRCRRARHGRPMSHTVDGVVQKDRASEEPASWSLQSRTRLFCSKSITVLRCSGTGRSGQYRKQYMVVHSIHSDGIGLPLAVL